MPLRTAEYPNFSMDVHSLEGERTVVAAHGEIDLVTVVELLSTISEQLRAGDVVLDLRGVEFMDSSGVAALDRLLKEAAESGTHLAVCEALPAPVAHILEMTGMLGILTLVPCEGDA